MLRHLPGSLLWQHCWSLLKHDHTCHTNHFIQHSKNDIPNWVCCQALVWSVETSLATMHLAGKNSLECRTPITCMWLAAIPAGRPPANVCPLPAQSCTQLKLVSTHAGCAEQPRFHRGAEQAAAGTGSGCTAACTSHAQARATGEGLMLAQQPGFGTSFMQCDIQHGSDCKTPGVLHKHGDSCTAAH